MKSDAEQLIERIGQGEQVAAVDLIDLFYERIYAFLRRLCGQDADAADLTQRTFARVWQALPSFAGRSTVGSWIHSIAYHTYVDWCRSQAGAQARSTAWWRECISHQPTPEEIVSRIDRATMVYAAVEQLEQELRDTIHLHYYQELTLQETADAMNVATSTVKYRLRQALSALEVKFTATKVTGHPPASSNEL